MKTKKNGRDLTKYEKYIMNLQWLKQGDAAMGIDIDMNEIKQKVQK